MAMMASGINAQNDSTTIVELETTLGPIKIKLYDDTPLHRANFVKLVNEGFYDGVLFHRVIKDFMVQTGDPGSKRATEGSPLGDGDTGYTIEAEIKYPEHYHKYGAVAAARTGDAWNPERRSSGSQFYIVTGNKYERVPESLPINIANDYKTIGGTPHLDNQYTVFGEVVFGMETVDKIQNSATDRNDRPLEDIRVIKARVLSPAKASVKNTKPSVRPSAKTSQTCKSAGQRKKSTVKSKK